MHAFALTVSRTVSDRRRVHFIAPLAAFALGLFFAIATAHAATITVNNNGNGSGTASNCDAGNANTCTLRDAIAKAVGGDTINFNLLTPNTTISLSSELDFNYTANTNPISVDGGGTITLDGAQAVRSIRTNANTTTVLQGLTITGGMAPFGGGVYNDGGTLTISLVTLADNVAFNGRGGGIYNTGMLTLNESTLSGNTSASDDGGGIFNDGGTIAIKQSTLSGNRASANGGGISNVGTLTIMLSTLSGNSATNGGGIYNNNSLTVRQSTLSTNSADTVGGGIASVGGTLTVTQSTFSGNTAASFGGGGIGNGASTLTARHLSFVGNTSPRGGAILHVSGNASVERSLFQGNRSRTSLGGAIRKEIGATLNASYNSYWQNADPSGAQGSDCEGCTSNANPIVANPLLGPLQNNGSFTETYLPGAGSGAIDAAPCDPTQTVDQRGLSRPQGAQCDVGAVEVPVCTLDLLGDASVRPFSDALLALRLRLGVSGPVALNGIAAASEWPVAQIRWNACQPANAPANGCSFDLDGDGTIDPLVDSLLLLRIAMGFKDAAALQGINFPGAAPRSDWASISGYLQNTCGMTLP
jgi:hypothetical protein